jgi:hypothetical protein
MGAGTCFGQPPHERYGAHDRDGRRLVMMGHARPITRRRGAAHVTVIGKAATMNPGDNLTGSSGNDVLALYCDRVPARIVYCTVWSDATEGR